MLVLVFCDVAVISALITLILQPKPKLHLPSTTVVASSYAANFTATPQVLAVISGPKITYNDARALIVERFLKKYRSPFIGHGDYIVQAADKYNIPYTIVPAIAQCESNLGKVIPVGSNNAWGYGVYGETVTRFKDWKEGIDQVAKGLAKNYFSKGLDTPEKIMTKYTPSSNGSWAKCVSQFTEELL